MKRIDIQSTGFLLVCSSLLASLTACSGNMSPLANGIAALNNTTTSSAPNSTAGSGGGTGTYEVYSTKCETPSFAADAPTFYLDPVNGKATNDGLTPATALPGLATVMSSNLINWLGWKPTARGTTTWNGYPDTYNGEALITTYPNSKTAKIPTGSHLLLMSGDHGSPAVAGAILDKWIEIKPAPGASPVLHSISLGGTERWIVHGLTFTSSTPGGWLMFAGSNAFYGPANNIIFDGNTLSTPNLDPHTTPVATIKATVGEGIWMRDMECPTITNNKISIVETGISVYSGSMNEAAMDASTNKGERYVLVKGNEINYVSGNDGIDWAGDHMMIDGNYVHNFIETESGLHYDGMQGQPGSGQETQVETDIVFQNNRVLRQDDPNIIAPAYMQGIDTFDGTYDDIKVLNNYIVTNCYHGIAFYGTSDLVVDHNTVLIDESTADSGVNQTWIGAFTGKDGYVPSNITITNNIGYQIVGLPAASGAQPVGGVVANNIMIYAIPVNNGGTWTMETKTGTYASNNVIDPNVLSYYANWIASTFTFDLLPKSGTPVSGVGYQMP